MPYRNIARLVVAVLATSTLVACSDQSPVSPITPSSATPDGIAAVEAQAQAVEGSYTLTFVDHTGLPVSSLPAGSPGCELQLWAQVKDSSGALAQKGSVIFQACRHGGAGESAWRPKADCDSGAAAWTHLATQKVTDLTCGFLRETGNACIGYGCRANPITVGFRYKFIGQGVIANGGDETAADFTWVARP